MVNYTVNYIVYTAGHRHHHAGTQTQLLPSAPGVSSEGEHFPVFAPPSLPFNNVNLPFAFMSVVGNADDNHLYTTSGTKDIQTGNSDITVTIVYAPAGGGDGHGGPGIWVDAFNVNTGQFSDSDFVQVFTNSSLDAAKTATANNDGIVSSATAEDIRSLASVDGAPFLKWEKIGNPNVDTTTVDYNLKVKEGGIAFAFYQTPKKPDVNPPDAGREVWIFVSAGVKNDGGGFVIGPDGKPHPVDPWGPALSSMLNTVIKTSINVRATQVQITGAQKAAIGQIDAVKRNMG